MKENGYMKGSYQGKPYLAVSVDEGGHGYGIVPCDQIGVEPIWVRKELFKECVPKNKTSETDNINPDHYKKGGIETFDYPKAKMTPVQLEGYLLGNCLKYLSRYQYKNGVEDLKKCEWYVKELVSLKG